MSGRYPGAEIHAWSRPCTGPVGCAWQGGRGAGPGRRGSARAAAGSSAPVSDREHLRPAPSERELTAVFLHRERRKVRGDGTVRWLGGYLEVPYTLAGQRIELRFDPMDPYTPPKVFQNGRFEADTIWLDRHANSTGARKPVPKASPEQLVPPGIDPLDGGPAPHATPADPDCRPRPDAGAERRRFSSAPNIGATRRRSTSAIRYGSRPAPTGPQPGGRRRRTQRAGERGQIRGGVRAP